MPYFVYILYAASIDQYYVGHTEDVEDRLYRHTHSGSKSTKKAGDWQLVYTEAYACRLETYKREMSIKKKKSRKYIEWLLDSPGSSVPQGCRKITGSNTEYP